MLRLNYAANFAATTVQNNVGRKVGQKSCEGIRRHERYMCMGSNYMTYIKRCNQSIA